MTVCDFGTGPIDAAYKAVNQIIRVENDLTEFSVTSLTRGIDALGEVTVRVKAGTGETFTRPRRRQGISSSRRPRPISTRSTVFCRVGIDSSSRVSTSPCASSSGVYHG